CSFLYFSRLLTVLFVGERIYPLILNINANLALDPSGSQKGVKGIFKMVTTAPAHGPADGSGGSISMENDGREKGVFPHGLTHGV
ncbi:MAG: hypothetical protein WBJ52_07560, partial [Methanoregulaceae archaeon]